MPVVAVVGGKDNGRCLNIGKETKDSVLLRHTYSHVIKDV